MEISEIQNRRAMNQIWNGAKNHDFTPDFKSYDKYGNAELYWNCIIGAVRHHYEYEKLENVFLSFQAYEDSDVFEGLLWLGLENAVYYKELTERPVLSKLRLEYGRRFVEEYGAKYVDDYHIYDRLALAHYRRVLGQDICLDEYNVKLLDELEFSPQLSTDEIVHKAQELFKRWFAIRIEERRKNKKKKIPQISIRKKGNKSRYRRFGIGFADHPENIYGGKGSGSVRDDEHIRTKMTDAELRTFMTEKYGLSIFSPLQIKEIERELCRGNHKGCRLHFTKGTPVHGKIQNGFEALQKAKEAKQIESNKTYYRNNIAQNRTAISKLANKIQNSLLMHLYNAPFKSNYGNINPALVWRAVTLDDDRVFIKNERDDSGGLSVDILLDASTSQKSRQEIISTQAYIIAESLDRCGIPCRVMSFCSMTGYTILRVFTDYNEAGRNERIFEYVSNGCNRDGLAIRAAHYLMNETQYEHKLLIVLSDVKPNDIKKIQGNSDTEFIPYENTAGLTDTAYEVRRAKADSISVICVFTGVDEDLPSAKLVYGRDFARIQSMDFLADTVGNLIQNQIKNL